MTVRNYAILYVGGKRTRGGTVVGGGTIVEGGNGVLDTEPHALDGGEHSAASDLTRLNATVDAHGLLLKLSGDADDALRGDGTWGPTTTAETVVGEVTADGTPFTISSGADFRGFPGVAWLDSPTASVHGVGDRFLIVYYHGDTHLTNGSVVGKIATITDTDPWTYSMGSEFDIVTAPNTPRCDDAVSVLDIGGTYYAVVAAREYSGSVNHTPFVLVCDDEAEAMTSASTWTRHDITVAGGHTQDWIVSRVSKLANGRYMVPYGFISGATHTNGVAWVTDITDWSAPNLENINSSASALDELDVQEVSPGTLYANIRNDATGNIDYSLSTDSGDTWSAPVTMFAGTHFPTWRVLTSGIGLITYADPATFHVAYRQTTTGATDSGWGAEVLIEATPSTVGAYATILQLDANHVLVIYGVESTEPDPVDSDLYSEVFTDSTVYASGGLVQVSVADTTPGYLEDKIAAGVGITVTVNGTGGNESLEISTTQVPGHYEVIVSGTAPPVAVTNIAEDDWVYGFVAD